MITGTAVLAAGGQTATVQVQVQPPAVPAAGLVVGMDISVNGVEPQDSGANQFPQKYQLAVGAVGANLGLHMKWFGGTGGYAGAIANRRAAGSTEAFPLLTTKTQDAADLKAVLDAATGPVGVCTWQEFENDLGGALKSIDDVNARNLFARRIIDAHPNGHFVELQFVGMGSNEVDGGIYTGLDFSILDAGGFDSYASGAGKAKLTTGADLFETGARMRDLAVKANPRFKWRTSEWAIARYVNAGPKKNPPVQGTAVPLAQRIAVMQDHLTTAQALGMDSINYWDSDNSNVNSDWTIHKAGDHPVAAVLAAAITR